MNSPKTRYLLVILLFSAIPFLIVPILRLINSYTLFPPLPDVGNKEWVGFLGSYLGGSITLCGVYLSFWHTNKNRIYDAEKQRIKKETEIITDHLKNIDISICSDIMRKYGKCTRTIDKNTIFILEDIIYTIDKKITDILKFDSFMNDYIDILYNPEECDSCNTVCDICNIKREFIEKYKILDISCKLTKIREIINNNILLLKIADDIKNIENKNYVPEDFKDKIDEIKIKQQKLYDIIISSKEDILHDISEHNAYCMRTLIPCLLQLSIEYENKSILAIQTQKNVLIYQGE